MNSDKIRRSWGALYDQSGSMSAEDFKKGMKELTRSPHNEPRWAEKISWVKACDLFPAAMFAAAVTNFGTTTPTIAQTQTLKIVLRNGVLTMSDSTGSERRGDALWDGERWVWMFELPRNQSWFDVCDSVPTWARHIPWKKV